MNYNAPNAPERAFYKMSIDGKLHSWTHEYNPATIDAAEREFRESIGILSNCALWLKIEAAASHPHRAAAEDEPDFAYKKMRVVGLEHKVTKKESLAKITTTVDHTVITSTLVAQTKAVLSAIAALHDNIPDLVYEAHVYTLPHPQGRAKVRYMAISLKSVQEGVNAEPNRGPEIDAALKTFRDKTMNRMCVESSDIVIRITRARIDDIERARNNRGRNAPLIVPINVDTFPTSNPGQFARMAIDKQQAIVQREIFDSWYANRNAIKDRNATLTGLTRDYAAYVLRTSHYEHDREIVRSMFSKSDLKASASGKVRRRNSATF